MNSLHTPKTDIDQLLKDKWRKTFKEEIIENREKMEREKIHKIMEEKAYLDKIQRELEEEKLKNKYKKLKETNERMHEYQNFLEKKKIEDMLKYKEKEKDKDLVTLDLKSDENLKHYKENIIKLNENVENNMHKHRQFMQIFEKKPEYYINGHMDKISSSQILPHKTPVKNSELLPQSVNPYNIYKNSQKAFLQYNKDVIDNKERKRNLLVDEKRKNKEQILEELEKHVKYEEARRQYQIDQQRNYKKSLDNQIKDYEVDNKKNNYANYNSNANTCKFPQFSHKRVKSLGGGLRDSTNYLGDSFLEHNPILNPVPNYKHNRYLYRDNSSLKIAGNSILY